MKFRPTLLSIRRRKSLGIFPGMEESVTCKPPFLPPSFLLGVLPAMIFSIFRPFWKGLKGPQRHLYVVLRKTWLKLPLSPTTRSLPLPLSLSLIILLECTYYTRKSFQDFCSLLLLSSSIMFRNTNEILSLAAIYA